jgi:hypothetical protein
MAKKTNGDAVLKRLREIETALMNEIAGAQCEHFIRDAALIRAGKLPPRLKGVKAVGLPTQRPACPCCVLVDAVTEVHRAANWRAEFPRGAYVDAAKAAADTVRKASETLEGAFARFISARREAKLETSGWFSEPDMGEDLKEIGGRAAWLGRRLKSPDLLSDAVRAIESDAALLEDLNIIDTEAVEDKIEIYLASVFTHAERARILGHSKPKDSDDPAMVKDARKKRLKRARIRVERGTSGK